MDSFPLTSVRRNGCSVERAIGERKQSIDRLDKLVIIGHHFTPGVSCPHLEKCPEREGW